MALRGVCTLVLAAMVCQGHEARTAEAGVGGAELVVVCRVSESGEEREDRVSASTLAELLEATLSYEGPCAELGPPQRLGAGELRSYAQLGTAGHPESVGVVWTPAVFRDLPEEAHDGQRCLDLDEDGEIRIETECVGGHERVLFLPRSLTSGGATPFRWVLVNWNPTGHNPQGVWTVPHFDFHFFIQSLADRNAIRMGRCALLVSCEDLEEGIRPVPAKQVPPGYRDRGVVEFGMGNHLMGEPGAEGRPSHAFIYGAWAGRISFYEPMITLAWLEAVGTDAERSGCFAIPQPEEWDPPGFYPTEYCIRYRRNRGEYTVSLEAFRFRSHW